MIDKHSGEAPPDLPDRWHTAGNNPRIIAVPEHNRQKKIPTAYCRIQYTTSG